MAGSIGFSQDGGSVERREEEEEEELVVVVVEDSTHASERAGQTRSRPTFV